MTEKQEDNFKCCSDEICHLDLTNARCCKCGKTFEDCVCDVKPGTIYQVASLEKDKSIEYYMCDTFKTALKFVVELLNADIDKHMPSLNFKCDKLNAIDEAKIFKYGSDSYDFNSYITIRKIPLITSDILKKHFDFYFEDLLYFREVEPENIDSNSDSDSDSDA